MLYTANGGPGATQLGYAPINSVSNCTDWAALHSLDTVGLQYGGQCFGCSGCNYSIWGVTSCDMIAYPLGCAYSNLARERAAFTGDLD